MNKWTKWTISGAMALSLMTPIVIQASTTASAVVWVGNGEAAPHLKPATVYSSTSMKKKLGTIHVGKEFKYTSKGKKWTKLKFKGQTGYILTKGLRFYQIRADVYTSAVAIGKRLTKHIQQLTQAEAKGDMIEIHDKIYPSFVKSLQEIKAEIKRDGLTKAQIAKIKKESINPADKQAKRFGGSYEIWHQLNEATNQLNTFNYEDTQKIVDETKLQYDEVKNAHSVDQKLITTMARKMKDVERRFSYSTFNDLHSNVAGSELKVLTGQEKDVFNKKHSNGVITTKYASYKTIFSFLNGQNNVESSGLLNYFKKMTFTMTAGEYWKNKKQDVDTLAEMYVDCYTFSDIYTLDSTKKSVKVSINLEEINHKQTSWLMFSGSFDRDVIISDIKFYR